jgi:hypothetical protein
VHNSDVLSQAELCAVSTESFSTINFSLRSVTDRPKDRFEQCLRSDPIGSYTDSTGSERDKSKIVRSTADNLDGKL